MANYNSTASPPQSHLKELADAAYSFLVEQGCTSSDSVCPVSYFTVPAAALKSDPNISMLAVLAAHPDRFRIIVNAGKASDAAVYAIHPPPLQSPLADVLAAATPIERAHQIIDRSTPPPLPLLHPPPPPL
jgi:hypothetical protein